LTAHVRDLLVGFSWRSEGFLCRGESLGVRDARAGLLWRRDGGEGDAPACDSLRDLSSRIVSSGVNAEDVSRENDWDGSVCW
jgi:hypothetical protein